MPRGIPRRGLLPVLFTSIRCLRRECKSVKSPAGQSDQISCNGTTLQRTAPRCNARHHAATHGTTLQRTAPRCNARHQAATHGTTLQQSAPRSLTSQSGSSYTTKCAFPSQPLRRRSCVTSASACGGALSTPRACATNAVARSAAFPSAAGTSGPTLSRSKYSARSSGRSVEALVRELGEASASALAGDGFGAGGGLGREDCGATASGCLSGTYEPRRRS
jgi:hypothetical protein